MKLNNGKKKRCIVGCATLFILRAHDVQTYVRMPWLIVFVNIGYSFNVHARLPLCVAMSKHCEEPGCSLQTPKEDR